ncbi:MAG: SGNH/GDSL hydrolase family protein [Flavobacteriales bacterium]
MKRLSKQFLLFGVLIVFAEIGLRAVGEKPGVLDAELFPPDTMIYDQLFQADSLGISSYFKESPILPNGHVINRQGFLGSIDYDKATMDSIRSKSNKKVVMLVGDSYTEGCCANPLDSSFAARLMNDTNFVVLNFGVGATDLTQYQLVVERYVKEIAPDLVVVMFYLGNDISWNVRTISPNAPVCYPIRDYLWLNSVGPPHLMNLNGVGNYFSTPEQAYQFYLRSYTLWSAHANTLEKFIRLSVLFSKIYLAARERYMMFKHHGLPISHEKLVSQTNDLLKQIHRDCLNSHVPVIISTIPSPEDADDDVNLETEYSQYFNRSHINALYPNIKQFSALDYDGMETRNHFNNSGHRKYYHFLDSVIRTEVAP